MHDSIDALMTEPRVRAARAHIERSDEVTLARQAALSAIPAPTGAEAARGARVAELFREVGLEDVKVDEVGNVRGWYGNGGQEKRDGCVVLSAHLDTVFGPELDVSVSRLGARLQGPGISDNARGLAALVAVAEALTRARVATARPVLFAATVGEEGSGDLRGVRHLFDGQPLRPHAFIALDGAGLERIVHRALGARRYRVTYRGPGGHSWAAFGVANPANAVGRATALLADLPTQLSPRSTCAVVRLGGGTGMNSIPQEAWLDLDLRSEDPRALAQLDETVHSALQQALEEENRHRTPSTAALALDVRRVGDRPSGITPRTHPLVQVAVAATRAVGREHQLTCASTDANLPIALGVPAVALGAGGRAGDAHLPTEWYENEGGALGVVRALLVTAAMAEAR
ncbi:MAG TPA: M20/M25/M40 family metallo-hydrolase [Gemmatimonadales bacterium]|nr:M20/M25/M40 family metallo-hydrolase [Gemmatimonadales bacterium]